MLQMEKSKKNFLMFLTVFDGGYDCGFLEVVTTLSLETVGSEDLAHSLLLVRAFGKVVCADFYFYRCSTAF